MGGLVGVAGLVYAFVFSEGGTTEWNKGFLGPKLSLDIPMA